MATSSGSAIIPSLPILSLNSWGTEINEQLFNQLQSALGVQYWQVVTRHAEQLLNSGSLNYDGAKTMRLKGRFRISEPSGPRKTCGLFSGWMTKNQETFRSYFGDLSEGSLNVDIDTASNLHQQLDRGDPPPALTIPRDQLKESDLGNGQAWRVLLIAARIPDPHECWVFRRIGSKVPPNVLEILSTVPIVKTFDVRDGEYLELVFLA